MARGIRLLDRGGDSERSRIAYDTAPKSRRARWLTLIRTVGGWRYECDAAGAFSL